MVSICFTSFACTAPHAFALGLLQDCLAPLQEALCALWCCILGDGSRPWSFDCLRMLQSSWT